jgi:cell division protease FtsH
VSTLPEPAPERPRIPYNPVFLEQVRAGNVQSISSKGATVQGELRAKLRYPPGDEDAKPTALFKTEVPTFANQDKLSRTRTSYRTCSSERASGGITAFGRSRARRIEASQQPVDFDDVAGIDEAKAELVQIVDFLKDPEKYRRLGGRSPRRASGAAAASSATGSRPTARSSVAPTAPPSPGWTRRRTASERTQP